MTRRANQRHTARSEPRQPLLVFHHPPQSRPPLLALAQPPHSDNRCSTFTHPTHALTALDSTRLPLPNYRAQLQYPRTLFTDAHSSIPLPTGQACVCAGSAHTQVCNPDPSQIATALQPSSKPWSRRLAARLHQIAAGHAPPTPPQIPWGRLDQVARPSALPTTQRAARTCLPALVCPEFLLAQAGTQRISTERTRRSYQRN